MNLNASAPLAVAESLAGAKGLSQASARFALRAATQSAHTRLEQNPCLRRLMDDDVSPHHYALVLKAFLSWHRMMDLALADLDQIDPDAPARGLKPAWLESDLRQLDVLYATGVHAPAGSPDATLDATQCGFGGPGGTLAQRLGLAYVVEGATLGGEVIARHLTRVLGANVPTQFFRSYGDQRGPMWRRLQDLLEKYLPDQPAVDAAIGAARAAFQSLDGWMDRHRSDLVNP